MKVDFFHLRVKRAPQLPPWASLVERWYQLDEAAYGLADGFWTWRDRLVIRPQLIVLASPGASNATDFEFTQSGCTHAAKFVHTLPNVRGTSLYQVMNWSGPMLCVQDGERTLISALSEAMDEFSANPREIWVFSFLPDSRVTLLRLHEGERSQFSGECAMTPSSCGASSDDELLKWLMGPEAPCFKWSDAMGEKTLHTTMELATMPISVKLNS